MNLVQIQERLKDLPTQALMQIANGGSPIAPPYLALGELKRRESLMQSAQGQQAMQQGQQPSVKEQVEQAAGLAGLQKQMQAQGMQSLMAQARPQGVPQNIPQPERQGESEGVAGLPTGEMYNFRNGGIVAFENGGFAEEMAGAAMPEDREERRKPTEEEVQRIVDEMRRQGRPIELSTILDIRSGRVPVPPVPISASPKPQEAATPPAGRGGVPAGAMPPPATVQKGASQPTMAQRPTALAGIAAIPGAEKASKMMLETMETKPTLEAEATEAEKSRGLFGLTQPYGEERMKRIQEMQAARQQELEPRGMERLMRVMGGIAGRGLAGAGPAYLQSMESERAADAAFRKQMDELLGGVEEARRKEAMGTMTDAQKRKARKEEMAIGAAEKIVDIDTKFKTQELQAKAATGRLSAEEQYILSEIQKGRSYPDILGKIAEAKAGPRAETAEQQRFKDTYLKVAKAYDDMMIKPKDMSRDEYIRREVDKAMGNASIGGESGAAVPQQAIDRLKQNPQLQAQFDEWYGAGASAKYLGK